MVYERCYAQRTKILLRSSYFIIIILLLAGCNLASVPSDAPITDTPPSTRTLTIQDTQSTPDNANPALTATQIQSGNATEASCQIQDNWFEYTIQRGDNLTRIANITDSTVDELIAANCLESPNRIRVGQTIYVPNEAD
jgi:LysM repeat protein